MGESTADSVPLNGWEVVQSVVHQTLDLIILVRVQASQPLLSNWLNHNARAALTQNPANLLQVPS